MKSKVYFSSVITPEKVLELYKCLGVQLPGNVALKVHSGEPGNQNFLRPEFWKPIVDHVGGTVVECNTAYEGGRNTTERHVQVFKKHGWSDLYTIDLLDATGPDLEFDIPQGVKIKKNFVGKDLKNYDSTLVLSHFKGHPMGGYGGALKQLSIGFASSYGKGYIHGVGDPAHFWDRDQDSFLESMADAAWSVVDYFKGNAAYINVMKNISVDCDCCDVAEDPCMADIGILASLDPVAIDQACLDIVYASKDPGRDHLLERIESRHGVHTIEIAAQHGIGSREYELINID
ncbi:MAG: DUF362 domain-containing protein [Oscillospiraceae bacterium]|nr:DUF362 domain-containing protein [Oscillospiraceae bacterium]